MMSQDKKYSEYYLNPKGTWIKVTPLVQQDKLESDVHVIEIAAFNELATKYNDLDLEFEQFRTKVPWEATELLNKIKDLEAEIRELNAMFVKETRDYLELAAATKDCVGALQHSKAAMKYAFEDHADQYYVNVEFQIDSALAKHADLIGKLR